ncbi:hypothetical protein GCM10007385_36180 [Tateyamaria omphalii]|nr:hypothetical protein GCM10007385_36180 [Tateyamaria omphalii]
MATVLAHQILCLFDPKDTLARDAIVRGFAPSFGLPVVFPVRRRRACPIG